jgi:hypothetical protein
LWPKATTEKKEERTRSRKKKTREEKAGFFLIFGPDFLHAQAMKSTLIYRGWKMVILSSHGKNFSPWFGW